MSTHYRTFECPKCGAEQEIEFIYRAGMRSSSYYEPDDPEECEQQTEVEDICPGCGKHFCEKRITLWEIQAQDSVFRDAPGDEAEDYTDYLMEERDYLADHPDY